MKETMDMNTMRTNIIQMKCHWEPYGEETSELEQMTQFIVNRKSEEHNRYTDSDRHRHA